MSILLLVKITAALSQTAFFQGLSNSPPDVKDLALNYQGDIIAATDDGIFCSTDHGERWTEVGLRGLQVEHLAVNSNGHIFALIRTVGRDRDPYENFCYSNDNGISWTRKRINNTDEVFLNCIAINPKGHIFAGFEKGIILRSINNGQSWLRSKVSPSYNIKAFTFTPQGSIFAIGDGGFVGGVFRSINNGVSWTFSDMRGLVGSINSNSKGHIFLGTSEGILRSVDNGKLWHKTALPKVSYVNSLISDSNGYIFTGTALSFLGEPSGLFCSKDNGNNWAHLSSTPVQRLFLDSQNYLFIIDQNGNISRSINPTKVLKGEPLIDASCADEPNTRSEEATFKTSFTIKNQTKMTLIVYWLDYRGNRGESFEIAPNAIRQQNTFETHKFLVADSTGKCIRIFEAPAKIVIQ